MSVKIAGLMTLKNHSVAHHPLHIALVIPFAGTTEPVLEQVMGLQLHEGSSYVGDVCLPSLSFRILATASFVLSYRMLWGDSTQEGEGRDVAVKEGLGGLPWVCFDEASVAVGQVQDEIHEPCCSTPADHRQGFPEVTLGMAWSRWVSGTNISPTCRLCSRT